MKLGGWVGGCTSAIEWVCGAGWEVDTSREQRLCGTTCASSHLSLTCVSWSVSSAPRTPACLLPPTRAPRCARPPRARPPGHTRCWRQGCHPPPPLSRSPSQAGMVCSATPWDRTSRHGMGRRQMNQIPPTWDAMDGYQDDEVSVSRQCPGLTLAVQSTISHAVCAVGMDGSRGRIFERRLCCGAKHTFGLEPFPSIHSHADPRKAGPCLMRARQWATQRGASL